MRIVCQTFSLPKTGREFADYEDAYYPCHSGQLAFYVEDRADLQSFRAAVCDGATDSCFSKDWAELLAAGYGQGEWSEDVGEKDIAPAQKSWQAFLATQELPWFAEEKAKLGAFAAVVGLTVDQGGAWKAVAVGDSCLFHTRQGALVEAFPIKTSVEFSNFPFLIGSLPQRNGGVFEHKMTRQDGRWQAGDIFFLMSDAIACWFLKTVESGAAGQSIDWLSQLNNHEAFSQLVAAERQQLGDDGLASMRDDDVTFMKLVVDGQAVDVNAAGSQASTAPRIKAGSGRASGAASTREPAPPVSGKPATAEMASPSINTAAAPGTGENAAGSGSCPSEPVSTANPSTASGATARDGSSGATTATATARGPAENRPDPPKPAQKSVVQVPPLSEDPSPPALTRASKAPLQSAKQPTQNKMIIGGIAAALIAAGGVIAMMTLGPARKPDHPVDQMRAQPATPTGKNQTNAASKKVGNAKSAGGAGEKTVGSGQNGKGAKNGAHSQDSTARPVSRDMPDIAPSLGGGDTPPSMLDQDGATDQGGPTDQDGPGVAPDRQRDNSVPPDSVRGSASRPAARRKKPAVSHASQDKMPPPAPPFKKNDQSYMP